MALLHFSTFISFKEIEREISSRWLKTKTLKRNENDNSK